MNESTVHQDFKGYGAYPLPESELLVRRRLLNCLHALREKNESCLNKARDQGREKLMEHILCVGSRVKRIAEEMEKPSSGVSYRLDPIPVDDGNVIFEIDERLEAMIVECSSIMAGISCSETDMHIADRYAQVLKNLREIESRVHERAKLFKRMRVYG